MTRQATENFEIVFNNLMQRDLSRFVHRCFVELNPGKAMSQAPHLRILAAKLQDCPLVAGRSV
jgi:hypothetical protein